MVAAPVSVGGDQSAKQSHEIAEAGSTATHPKGHGRLHSLLARHNTLADPEWLAQLLDLTTINSQDFLPEVVSLLQKVCVSSQQRLPVPDTLRSRGHSIDTLPLSDDLLLKLARMMQLAESQRKQAKPRIKSALDTTAPLPRSGRPDDSATPVVWFTVKCSQLVATCQGHNTWRPRREMTRPGS